GLGGTAMHRVVAEKAVQVVVTTNVRHSIPTAGCSNFRYPRPAGCAARTNRAVVLGRWTLPGLMAGAGPVRGGPDARLALSHGPLPATGDVGSDARLAELGHSALAHQAAVGHAQRRRFGSPH